MLDEGQNSGWLDLTDFREDATKERDGIGSKYGRDIFKEIHRA